MSLLLKNAFESVRVGLIDLKKGDPERVVSSLRNIHAGILLMIKEVLRRLSPLDSNEVLIKTKILPVLSAGKLSFVGDGKKTIDIQDMKERCKSLKIEIEWKALDKVASARNNAEHYYPDTKPEVIGQILSESFSLIHSILVDKLGISEPNLELGQEEWSYLLENHEVHAKERKKVLAAINALKLHSSNLQSILHEAVCEKCGLDLLLPEDVNEDPYEMVFVCRSCGERHSLRILAANLLHKFYGDRPDEWFDESVIQCPSCMEETYEVKKGVCALCGESAPQVCSICQNEIPSCEIDGEGVCGYCSHMMNKDD